MYVNHVHVYACNVILATREVTLFWKWGLWATKKFWPSP